MKTTFHNQQHYHNLSKALFYGVFVRVVIWCVPMFIPWCFSKPLFFSGYSECYCLRDMEQGRIVKRVPADGVSTRFSLAVALTSPQGVQPSAIPPSSFGRSVAWRGAARRSHLGVAQCGTATGGGRARPIGT